MKKVALLTISLGLACAVFSGGAVAFADGGNDTHYPEKFTESVSEKLGDISDYAVYGNSYAFADGGEKITLIKDDTRTVYSASGTVTAVDCDGNGNFFYKDAAGTHSLPDKELAEHIFRVFDIYTTASYIYDWSDCLYATDRVTHEESKPLDGFTCVKVYDGVLYAVKDGKLNKIVGLSGEEIALTYTDYAAVKTVKIGAAKENIKDFNADKLHFVSLKHGEYLTEIDLNDFNGPNFKAGETFKVGEKDGFAEDDCALLLCQSGNADIVMIGGKGYIKLSDPDRVITREAAEASGTATVSITESYAYSSPFVSVSTQLIKLTPGEQVEIIGRVKVINNPELMRDFDKIEYENENGEKSVGYVPVGYLSEFTFSEENPSKTDDPDYKDGNLVTTVVLILVIVVLVLTAAGYITYVVTAQKKKADGENKK